MDFFQHLKEKELRMVERAIVMPQELEEEELREDLKKELEGLEESAESSQSQVQKPEEDSGSQVVKDPDRT